MDLEALLGLSMHAVSDQALEDLRKIRNAALTGQLRAARPAAGATTACFIASHRGQPGWMRQRFA